jgi:hypothetical protein
MSAITYYVALPFARSEDGDIIPGVPRECTSPLNPIHAARQFAAVCAGAVAFSRSGNPATGEFEDATIRESRNGAEFDGRFRGSMAADGIMRGAGYRYFPDLDRWAWSYVRGDLSVEQILHDVAAAYHLAIAETPRVASLDQDWRGPHPPSHGISF